MKSTILLAFSLFLCFQTQAQTSPGSSMSRLSRNDWNSILRGTQSLTTTRNPEVELRGHPFSMDDWRLGSIILKDSSQSEDKTLRFKLNVEDSEIWVQVPDKPEHILTDNRIVGLILNVKDTFVEYRKFVLPESPTTPRFAQIIYSGKNFTLVKYIKKTFIKADYVDKGLAVVGRKYDSYEAEESYLVIGTDTKTSKIKLSKGDILKATASVSRAKREEILTFCKENDISNPLDEADAALMMSYIDKLQ
ncbi:MAG: hypothetical protein JNL70_11045 [Saprospiraceae bacterium]|nr:hypothetical protein [Saprospiraceae bacterium]